MFIVAFVCGMFVGICIVFCIAALIKSMDEDED